MIYICLELAYLSSFVNRERDRVRGRLYKREKI